ncbi:dTDP-4-dehydrorhamnose 3,5-epimerase family protein [Catenovulum maritimum]|uniref:dTDP-4-dehydrorhamnose 3,5-epimerase n=1 Tax=Catenovulum maritimum TaxID=1513271 RepID=A0A0J8GUY5_9ALTE|nr:dTDP-4-dehydrorhamnose 3,5-epimerase family protein [Catenovulum maritimum]KMT66590.1 dTDP-4-dehydrorhamnose 3,5-epimerase [Catenovulum maritimum]
MRVLETALPDVKLIELDYFEDFRGTYLESYNREEYQKQGISIDFVQDDFSMSRKHVLRGIHGDTETWKLVSCIEGCFRLVVVNCDTESELFGQWVAFDLSETNARQVLIPPKHGNAHLVLSDRAIFHYKQSTYYNPNGQFTYKWNDPKFNIWWPIDNPILSQRDDLGRRV